GSVANGQTRYKEVGRRLVRSSRGRCRQNSSRVRIKQSQDQGVKQEADRMQVQGLMGTIHQGPDCRPGHSLNTPPAISLR
ncbi:unnamed protein product, partial [Staurois parvus]